MRFLVLFAHPDPQSFNAALHRCVVKVLGEAGHEVDDCDLYAEGFDPVLSLEERRKYNHEGAPHPEVKGHVDRLNAAQGLFFVAPTWNFGMPAILKGYLDRVWLPGVAFEMAGGHTRSLLGHVKKLGVVTTYGGPRLINEWIVGDPNRKAFRRGIGNLVSSSAGKLWLARYGMDSIGADARARFLAHVEAKVRAFA